MQKYGVHRVIHQKNNSYARALINVRGGETDLFTHTANLEHQLHFLKSSVIGERRNTNPLLAVKVPTFY